jgi:lipooligosaccharide transport system permease protein
MPAAHGDTGRCLFTINRKGVKGMRVNLSGRFIRVWQRNLTVYRKIWKISFIPPLLEPLFYLLAFGIGLSALVGEINYQGNQVTYMQFIAPALIAITIMYNAFFETTYASFVRMYYQRTFDAMLATPLFLEEIITGEIIWGATKSLISAGIMIGVISLFGLIHYPHGLLVLPLAFLGGMAFGSIGMFFTGIIPTIETFNLPIFLFITPMFLFSGTFFPIENLPLWAQKLSIFFPLTHLVKLTRSFCLGKMESALWWYAAYLLLFCLVFFPIAIFTMHRRLIK